MSFVRVVLTLLLWVAAAHADPTVNAQAKKLYLSGTNHYELSEFDAALADFREAYRIKDDPVFLYNVAQCYRQLKHEEDAIQFYRSYLRRVPAAKNRAEVEARIAGLERDIAARPAPTPEPVAVPAPMPAPVIVVAPAAEVVAAPPPRPTPLYKKWWLWTAVGGVVVVGLGVGLGVGLTQGGHTTPTFSGVTF